MNASLINLMTTALVAFSPPVTEWEPAITDQYLDQRSLAESEPSLLPLVAGQSWNGALTEAAIPLVHSYLNLQVVSDDPALYADAEQWWSRMLTEHPAEAALALARLDTKYIVWNVRSWPGTQARHADTYRYVIMKMIFQAHHALSNEIAVQRELIESQVPPDLTPPEGMPFRAAPSSIRDPELRAEYQARLDESARQRNERFALKDLENANGELLHVLPSNVEILYADAEQAEIDELVDLIDEYGWRQSQLTGALSKSWPAFRQRLDPHHPSTQQAP